MGLAHTFVQTHRHYIDSRNQITVDEARGKAYPLLAECGTVWIPGPETETQSLDICARCRALNPKSVKSRRDSLPHYVYRCFDADGRLIYVGCSVWPPERLAQHKLSSWWFPQVETTRFIIFPSKSYALQKEREAIRTENPRWNIRGRDRALWSVDDYADCFRAMSRNGSAARARTLAQQAERRFGLADLESRWSA